MIPRNLGQGCLMKAESGSLDWWSLDNVWFYQCFIFQKALIMIMVNHNVSNFTTPSYVDFVYGVSTAYRDASKMMAWNDVTPIGWMSTLQKANYTYLDILYVLLCAVTWTILRIFCSKVIFQVRIKIFFTLGAVHKGCP